MKAANRSVILLRNTIFHLILVLILRQIIFCIIQKCCQLNHDTMFLSLRLFVERLFQTYLNMYYSYANMKRKIYVKYIKQYISKLSSHLSSTFLYHFLTPSHVCVCMCTHVGDAAFLFFKFSFLIEGYYLTQLCLFLPHINMNQPQVYICPLPPSLPPTFLLQVVTEPQFEFPESYSKFTLAVYFTYGNVCFHVTLTIHPTLSLKECSPIISGLFQSTDIQLYILMLALSLSCQKVSAMSATSLLALAQKPLHELTRPQSCLYICEKINLHFKMKTETYKHFKYLSMLVCKMKNE